MDILSFGIIYMSHTTSITGVQMPHEDPTIQFGKDLYFPIFTEPAGFGGELTLDD